MRDPATLSLLGASQNAVTAFERGGAFCALALGLFQREARWFSRRFGIPIVGDGDRFALFDIDDAQYRDLGHAAHAVIGGFLTVDQAFLGHVLEQRLECDLLLPFQPESFGDLTFARRAIGVLDEIEDLLCGGQALGVI